MLRTKITVEKFNENGDKTLHLCDLHHDNETVTYPSNDPAKAYLLDQWGYVEEDAYADLQDEFDALDNEEQDVGQDDGGWFVQTDVQNLPCGVYDTRYVSQREITSCLIITKDEDNVKYVYASSWKKAKPIRLSRLQERGIEFKTMKVF